MMKSLHMELLLCYVREDGLFARLILNDRDAALNASVRKPVTEETLRDALSELIALLSKEVALTGRCVTVAVAFSRKVEVLRPCVSELLSSLSFVDSVSVLLRDELFYRAVTVLSEDGPCQVLYCDSRETRLFTEAGEIPLSGKRTGGNGFYDWLLGFVENEEDSLSYYEGQIDRVRELFRVYRCYAPAAGGTEQIKKGMPDRAKYPLLYSRPAVSDSDALHGKLFSVQKRKAPPVETESPREEERIDYTVLSASERARVDRRLPAFYRAARDRYGKPGRISMALAAECFARLFDGIRDAELTHLVAVGRYADFPLTGDLLRSLPQEMTVSYESESKLLLDGMEQAVTHRISSSRLMLHDMDGDAIVLWDSSAEKDGSSPEKRISFSMTTRNVIHSEEWKKKAFQMPYVVEFEELRRDENGGYRRVRITKSGDFRKFCYRRQKDGSYRLRLPETENGDSAFRTAVLGVSATPVGISCRLLSDEGTVSS